MCKVKARLPKVSGENKILHRVCIFSHQHHCRAMDRDEKNICNSTTWANVSTPFWWLVSQSTAPAHGAWRIPELLLGIFLPSGIPQSCPCPPSTGSLSPTWNSSHQLLLAIWLSICTSATQSYNSIVLLIVNLHLWKVLCIFFFWQVRTNSVC